MDNITEFILSTQPYDHQLEALQLAWSKQAYALFLEMGTGKSKIIVDEIVNLIERDMINVAIIIAPNNVHVNWKDELIKHGPPDYNKWAIQIYRSKLNTRNNKVKFEKETRGIINSGKCLVFLINIEALSGPSGATYLQRILTARRKGYMVIDESHKIKNSTAVRTKTCIELGRLAYIKRIATGTEAEEGLENLYSQFRFLDQNIIGLKTYTAFKHMFCIENQSQLASGQIFRQIVGYQNKEILARRIAPYVYSKRKKDCLDLPDKVYVTHQIEMEKEQERIYNQLQEELIYELKSGAIVDASIAITKMIRLQQILCGHVNSSNPKESEIIPSNRATFVSEIVEQASDKVIVFCRFIKDVELILSALAKDSIRAVGVSSLVEGSQRVLEIDRWRQEPDIKVLAITIATGGTGLTLNEASTTIFYSNSWSSTDRIQAEDRNHRIGQSNKVTYHDIIVRNMIDHKLLLALKSKQQLAQQFRSIVDVQKFLTTNIEV
jgi:Mesyanzhinovviridae DNA helicase